MSLAASSVRLLFHRRSTLATVGRRALFIALFWGVVIAARFAAADSFRVVTYNVENYLDEPTKTRHVKPPEAKAKVLESILAAKPDVLALQEMGNLSALEELRLSLKANGLDLPHQEHV